MSFDLIIQKAIYEKLVGDAQIISKKIPIYDDVLQSDDSGDPRTFPYVVIGDDVGKPWDTDTELGSDTLITIHTWSRYAGKTETKEIQGFIYGALHGANFDIQGFNVVSCVEEDSRSFLDSDGKTRHGVQVFKMLIEKL